MSTIIYPAPIFGPVHSRRLGISLGINLMPADGKVCTFDCIYCECGFNQSHIPSQRRPTREEVKLKLEVKLQEMAAQKQLPDVLTFAGNGEPTAHPAFKEIIVDTRMLRDKYCPNAKISVLSNSTFIHHPNVFEALMLVDNNILKLDTIDANYIQRVDRPTGLHYKVEEIIENMKRFQGHIIIQTMFLKGQDMHGNDVSNLSDHYVLPWLAAVKAIQPQSVMVYTIDRETPDQTLFKATPQELDTIKAQVIAAGIPCSASY